MQRAILENQFNSQHIAKKYEDVWNEGIHLFSFEDHNRDFYYSIFYVDLLFVEMIYNKLNGEIITIKSFSDKGKLMFYLKENFR